MVQRAAQPDVRGAQLMKKGTYKNNTGVMSTVTERTHALERTCLPDCALVRDRCVSQWVESIVVQNFEMKTKTVFFFFFL